MFKKATANLLFFIVTLCFGLQAHQTIMKPRGPRRQQPTEVKKIIGKEFEKVLTSSTTLIASLSETIDTVVKKIKQLASGNDTFFSHQKAVQLQCYKDELVKVRKNFEKTVAQVEQELEAIKKNFEI